MRSRNSEVVVTGQGLTIQDIVAVGRHGAPATLTGEATVWGKIEESYLYIAGAAELGEPVYGVVTGFGGMANVIIPESEVEELQNNLIWQTQAGAGRLLPKEDVRAAMLLRANSHMKGASGIRRELILRMITFLNQDITPCVRELGSIGASGDLVPLSYITGALTGMDSSFKVDFRGEILDAMTALDRLNLRPLSLRAKEGLAMINGTSVMTAIAANCTYDAFVLLALSLGINALFIQALRGTNQSFHPFVHELKPHSGQVWVAETVLDLLQGSKMSRDELAGQHEHRKDEPIQDRYSLRCLAQYTGPIVDGFRNIAHQIEIESNSATDNPLIDVSNRVSYHAGNFLGQYIGVAMDQLRYYLGLLVKHLDAQISLLVAPEFNNGLPASLVGNTSRKVNMGLKALQICGNSIMPLVSYLGSPIADRYATHAEQFNQNINSLGFGSANLSRESIRLCHQYMAIALIFAVQAVDLRTWCDCGHYDATNRLSSASIPLYEAVKRVLGKAVSREKPLIWNDNEQSMDNYIELISHDIVTEGQVTQVLQPLFSQFSDRPA